MDRNVCVFMYELPNVYSVRFAFVDNPTEKWVIDVSETLTEEVLMNGGQAVVRDAEDAERVMTVINGKAQVIVAVDCAGDTLWLGGIPIAWGNQVDREDLDIAPSLDALNLFNLISEYLP